MQVGYYEFLSYGDLALIGVVALFLILRNWWDLIRYGLDRQAAAAAAPGQLRRVAGALRRLHRRGKPGRRLLRPHHA